MLNIFKRKVKEPISKEICKADKMYFTAFKMDNLICFTALETAKDILKFQDKLSEMDNAEIISITDCERKYWIGNKYR
jgi:hypothetical protein